MARGVALMVVMALSAVAGGAFADGLPLDAGQAARRAAVLRPVTEFTAAEAFEAMSGGAATGPADASDQVFSHPSGNMSAARQAEFLLGRGLFRKTWVAAPASTKGSDGLGPLYNARSCKDCHINDGRGHLPEGGERAVSVVLRLSVPGGDAPAIEGYLASLPHPVLGAQLQGFAAPGLVGEGELAVSFEVQQVVLADGLTVELRKPVVRVAGLGPEVMTSLRVAPPMIGLGLLEAIPEGDILAREDPEDADGDGISGRANWVISPEDGRAALGRFGLKAGMPSVRAQVAAALSTDMGLSNPVFPDPWGDCTVVQVDCRAAPVGQEPGVRDGLELDTEALDLLTLYARNLAVPGRRDVEGVLAGKEIFHSVGCAGCHQPKQVTARLGAGQAEQSFQLIWPFTDLLLHDMGEGLADNRPEARATGQEWRTAPLWGLGRTAQVSGLSHYLHDGRARTPLEAILWHGGEAQAARDAVVGLSTADRVALLNYLESL